MADNRGYAQVWVKRNTWTLIKALAHIDDRTVVTFMDRLIRDEANQTAPDELRAAIEAVTDDNPANA